MATPKNSEWERHVENVAMNIVYQLDDDSGASVEFRQANNDRRIDFVSILLRQLLQERSKDTVGEKLEELGDKFENLTFRDGKWICNYLEDQETGQEWKGSEGSTPLEALQKLSEQLNQK